MENVRTIIWDCDNVMWFHRKEEARILAKAIEIKDVDNFEEEFFIMLNMFNEEFECRKVTFHSILKIVEKSMPILEFNGISSEQFMKAWDKAKFEMNVLNEEIFQVMEYSKKRGLKNIIKTDWLREVQIDMLQEYGILKYIERIYSCDNSYLKCNPLSAREIIEIGEKAKCIIIGDSLQSDICFANYAGIKSIWLNKERKLNSTSFKPTYEITSLLEVMQIL